MSRLIKVVRAPIHGIAMEYSPGQFFTTGKLEEDTQFQIDPTYAGKSFDLRYLDSHITVRAYDMEATEDGQDFRNRAIYEGFQNAIVNPYILCGSGAFKEVNFRYNFYLAPLPKRGMRFVHQLTGISKNPQWITFLDEGWEAFYSSIPLESLDINSDLNLYQS